MSDPAPMFLPGLLGCKLCPLSETRNRVVPGFGNHDAKIMIVAQSPGVEEDRLGRPLIGNSGKFLTEQLVSMGYDLDKIAFKTNVNHCRPPDDRPAKPAEMRACRPFLDLEGERVDPTVIFAMGGAALQALLPDESTSVQTIRGHVYERELWGKVRYVIPMLHPAFVLRNPVAHKMTFRADLRLGLDIAAKGYFKSTAVPFRKTVATLAEIKEVIQSPLWGFDLETDTGNGADDDGDEMYENDQGLRGARIIGVGVCATPGNGLYLPFEDDFQAEEILSTVFKSALEHPARIKVVSNAKFERHICAGYGINLTAWEDTLLMAYVAGDYPLGLKDGFHKATQIEMQRIKTFYDRGFKRKDPRTDRYVVDMRAAQDADFPSVVAYAAQDPDASLRLFHVLKRLLVERKLWSLYRDLEVPFNDVVLDVERNGFLFDAAALDVAAADLRAGLETVYARIMEVVDPHAPAADKKNKGVRFNPGSWQQVQKALYIWPTPYRIPPFRETKNQKAMPTDKTSLAIYSSNPFIKDLLTYKAIAKMIGTYIEALPNWQDDAGRIHGEYKQATVATGRLAGANPNMTNIPARKRDDLAVVVNGSLIRNAFVAPLED